MLFRSVLIQDAETRRLAPDVSCRVRLRKFDSAGVGATAAADQESATNKIFRAAHVEFTSSGRWVVVAHVLGPLGEGEVQTIVEVQPPTPRWQDLSGWIAAPFAVLSAMGLQFLRRRKPRWTRALEG